MTGWFSWLLNKSIIGFLRNVMTETPAKRIVSMVLIAAGISNGRVTELTGLCGRSVLKDIEGLIIEMIETNNYHIQQETADMIYDE
jgi:hypothetical protein